MESNEPRFEKGVFSSSRFAVARKYLPMSSRSRLFLVGAVTALLFIALFLADAYVGRAAMVAGGLSEKHALFAKDCATCHMPGHGATNAKCESCHQQSGGDRPVYSFARHYEYRSSETDRSAPKHKEARCGSCHREHQGRENTLQRVADAQCVSCHTTGSFASGHPEFEFAAKKLTNSANLRFPHVLHVREVMERDSLKDAEGACLSCHTPKPDGRTFEPISYARGCDGCHLRPSEATPFLPLHTTGKPGAMTLSDIRREGGPGTQWVDHWNPNELTVQGGQIRKRPVYHADPWVLENLRRLRRELYPGAELADLLRTSPEMSVGETRVVHREAIRTLQAQIESVRGDPSPDVQRELATLTGLVQQLERKVDSPFAPLDETKFAVSEASRDTSRNEGAYRAVVDSLTKSCRECHVVDKATIRRVKTDQRALVRAEFNHRAHVTHARCLDCHNVIQTRAFLDTEDNPPAERDNATIFNLPAIATCRTCHTSTAAPTRCTSCHVFHPDKSHWAQLTDQPGHP